QICQQIVQLEARLNAVLTQLETLEIEKTQAQTDLTQLELHRKTLPFQTQLHRLNDKTAEIFSVSEETDRLEKELATLQIQAENANRTHQETKLNLKEIKVLRPQKLQLFEQAAALDASIEMNQAAFEKGKKDLAERTAEIEKNRVRKTDLENQLAAIRQSHAALEIWLRENTKLTELTKDLPAILLFRAQLRETLRTKNTAEQERNSFQTNLE
ncbi:MAG: hypothetical protein AAB316_04910, partial [Bacteroidota bacterium]